MKVREVGVPIEPIRATRVIYFGLSVFFYLFFFSHEQMNVFPKSVHCSNCVKPGASKGHQRFWNLHYVQLSVLYHASIHLGFTSIPMHNVFTTYDVKCVLGVVSGGIWRGRGCWRGYPGGTLHLAVIEIWGANMKGVVLLDLCISFHTIRKFRLHLAESRWVKILGSVGKLSLCKHS